MLILNLTTAKHCDHTPLSAYHLNSDRNYSQWPCLLNLKKIGNFQPISNVVMKNSEKHKNNDSIDTWIFPFCSSNIWSDKA